MDFLDSWAVVKLLSLDHKQAFTSMGGETDVRVNKKCIIGQVIRGTCDHTTTDLRARTPFYRYKLGPQNHNHGPTAVIHLRPTSDWPLKLCDRLATDPRPGRDRLELPVLLGKSLHEIKISGVTCDRFTTVPNDIRGHRMIYDQPAKTCD